jgi:threonine/homoserine/homoserine lactone efflux protein
LKLLAIYFFTLIISYLATIPPGPLSVFVVHTTLQKNIKIAIWIMLGGVLCESIYAFLAVQSLQIFVQYPKVQYWCQRIIILILLVVGGFTFFQKANEIKFESISTKGKFFSFIKGITLSLFNPALLPFWLVVLLSYQKYDFLKINTGFEKVSFVMGAGTGTLLLVFTYAFIANKKRDIIYKYMTDSRLNKLIGLIFIGLAVWQMIGLIFQ